MVKGGEYNRHKLRLFTEYDCHVPGAPAFTFIIQLTDRTIMTRDLFRMGWNLHFP